MELGLCPRHWAGQAGLLPACPPAAPAGGGQGKERERQVGLGPFGVQEQLGHGLGGGAGSWGPGTSGAGWGGPPLFPDCTPGAGCPHREGLSPTFLPHCPVWGLVGGSAVGTASVSLWVEQLPAPGRLTLRLTTGRVRPPYRGPPGALGRRRGSAGTPAEEGRRVTAVSWLCPCPAS